MSLTDLVRKTSKITIPIITSTFLLYSSCGKKNPTDPNTGNQPPIVEIISGPSGTIQENHATFEWKGSDEDGEIIKYYIDINDDTPDIETTETKYKFTNLSNGTNTFYLRAEDNQNALSKLSKRSFNVNIPGPGDPGDPIQPGITDEQGNAYFSDTFVTTIDTNSGESLEGFEVTYYSQPDAKVFSVEDPNKEYFPDQFYFTHNSGHILEMTKKGLQNYVLEKITNPETIEAIINFLDNLGEGFKICELDNELYYIGTFTGQQIKDHEKAMAEIYTIIPGTSNVIYQISTLEGNIEKLSNILGSEINFEDENWDKYKQIPQGDLSPITGTFTGNILRASQIPEVTLNPPEVNGDAVTLSWSGFDRDYYADGTIDGSLICQGPTSGSDLFYWVRVSNSPYENWRYVEGKSITINNLPAGQHEAQVKVKDDTIINETESNLEYFVTQEPEIAELGYDDGNPEYANTADEGMGFTVKFHPEKYPAKIRKAEYFLNGREWYPCHKSDTPFKAYIFDDNGEVILSLDVEGRINYGEGYWEKVDVSDYNIQINEGSFYIGMQFVENQKPCLGGDTQAIKENNYIFSTSDMKPREIFGEQSSFMIKAEVEYYPP